MTASRAAILSLIVLASLTIGAQQSKLTDAEQALASRIGKVRSLDDDVRAKETKALALEIRQLSAGKSKASLASSLTNLATEGDFGKDTLQEVATTLAKALDESPMPMNGVEPAYAYVQLAQLARYERMAVDLNSPSYTAALAKLDQLETIRAKVDFTLTDLSGKSWTRSALKGKVVLVNFWATWCPPCRKEMPDLEVLYNRFKDQGLVILSISDEERAKVEPFIAEHKYSYPILLDPGRKVNDAYKVDGIPKNFIYNREGKLVAQSIDMRTQRQFLELLAVAGLKLVASVGSWVRPSSAWLFIMAGCLVRAQSGPGELPASQMKLLPAGVQRLARELVGATPKHMVDICSRVLGKPNRDAGSGLTIWQWDFPEGVLSVTEQFPDPVFLLKSGRLIYLLPKQTPFGNGLFSEHEMDAPHPQVKGMFVYIGDLSLAAGGTFKFTDSGTNLDSRAGQKKNFFMEHPTGRFSVTYAKGIGPRTLLESITAKRVVATLAFVANGGKNKITYDLVCDPNVRRMWLRGQGLMPFKLEWNF